MRVAKSICVTVFSGAILWLFEQVLEHRYEKQLAEFSERFWGLPAVIFGHDHIIFPILLVLASALAWVLVGRRSRRPENRGDAPVDTEDICTLWDMPYEDAIRYIHDHCEWGRNKNWDWIRSDLWELVKANRLSLGVSSLRRGELEPIPRGVLKVGFAQVQNDAGPGVIRVFGHGHEDVYWHNPSFRRREIEAEYNPRRLYDLQSQIPCDYPAEAVLRYILADSDWGFEKSEAEAFAQLLGRGVSGQLLISTMRGTQRVYWYPEEHKGMHFVRRGSDIVMMSRMSDEVFHSPMLNRQQVHDLFPRTQQAAFEVPVCNLDDLDPKQYWSCDQAIGYLVDVADVGGEFPSPFQAFRAILSVATRERNALIMLGVKGYGSSVIQIPLKAVRAALNDDDLIEESPDEGPASYEIPPYRRLRFIIDQVTTFWPRSQSIAYSWTLAQAMEWIAHSLDSKVDDSKRRIEEALTQAAYDGDIKVKACGGSEGNIWTFVDPQVFSNAAHVLYLERDRTDSGGDMGIICRPSRRDDIIDDDCWRYPKFSEQEIKSIQWGPLVAATRPTFRT